MKAKKILAIALSTLLMIASMAVAVLPASASTNMVVSTGDYTVMPGDEFDVPITISNNPGIVSLAFKIGYDSDVLELVAKENGDFDVNEEGEYSFSKTLDVNPYKINWMAALAEEDITGNGTFMTLTFKVKEDAAPGATSTFEFTYDQADICNFDWEDIITDFVGGTVTVGGGSGGDVEVPEYTEPTIATDNYIVEPGDEFDLPITIYNNPGIISLAFKLGYDSDAFDLVAKTNGDFDVNEEGEYSFSKDLDVNPYKMNWMAALAEEDITTDGIFMTLTFKVKETAPAGDYTFDFTYDQADICNFDWEDVVFDFISGVVKVEGDVPPCEHEYDNACDTECNLCGEAREVPDHNFVDGSCTECGADDPNYEPPCEHQQEVECSKFCALCGEEAFPEADHEFFLECDGNCIYCNEDVRPYNHVAAIECSTTCQYCGQDVVDPVADHVYDNACDADCNNGCGTTREVPDHVYDNACDADCNECGLTREVPDHVYDNECVDTTCNECGAIREVLGHIYDDETDLYCNVCGAGRDCTHAYDNACDADCNICGATREVPDHEYDNACDADCNECGDIREVPDHVYDNACDADCNECGDIREVPDHVYDNACDADCNECGDIREVPDHVYDNACDADCNVCGATREVPDHVYDNACDADCNECGLTREVEDHVYDNACDADCNVCGDIREVPDHVYDNACGDADCNVCGAIRDDFAAHNFGDDNTCDECGYTRPELLYRVENGEVIITGLVDKTQTDIIVPAEIDGMPVVAIGNNAFLRCAKLRTIELPASLKSIGTGAFYGCTAMTAITIPEGVTAIGEYALQLTGLVTIDLPASLETVGNFAFNNSKGLKVVNYGGDMDDREAIDIGATRNNYLEKATWIYLGCDHTYTTACDADCDICGFVREAGAHDFNGGLTCVNCDAASELLKYRVEDGEVIITGLNDKDIANVVLPDTVDGMPVVRVDNNAFLRCTALESIQLPANLKAIGIGAFYGCTSLTEIVIPEGLTVLEEYSLQLTGIKTITLPSTLETVGAFAFNNCRQLKTVNYNGTEADREFIAIMGTRNTYLTNATWNYAE